MFVKILSPLVLNAILVFAALRGASPASNSTSDHVTLGVLEESAESMGGPDGVKTSYSRKVRMTFEKVDRDWKPFPSAVPDEKGIESLASKYPQETMWTVAFHGQDLGEVKAKTQKEFKFYDRVGWQDIIGSNSIPTIGKRSASFSGFIGTPVYRPLVTSSQPNFQDPDRWESTTLSADLLYLARHQFRKQFPTAYRCLDKEGEVRSPWPYRESDIKIMQSYSSKNHCHLVRLVLGNYLCDAPIEDMNDPYLDQWFLVSPGNKVSFLGAGMWLVDAGDYDGDGKSELVFSIDRYDRGGYELFYDDLKKHADFEFAYH